MQDLKMGCIVDFAVVAVAAIVAVVMKLVVAGIG